MEKTKSLIVNSDNTSKNLLFYITKIVVAVLFSSSMSILSVYFMVGNMNKVLEIFTAIISFFTSVAVILKKYSDIIEYVKNNKIVTSIFTIIGIIVFYEYRKISIASGVLQVKFENINIVYLIVPAICTIITLLMSLAKEWLVSFYATLDKYEKITHIALSIIFFIVLVILYTKKPVVYQGYDSVYSLDSKWVYNNIYQKTDYYDIRHPLLGIVTFPLYALADFLFKEKIKIVVLQFINVQLLLLIGLELKKITNSKYTYYLYLVSCPTIIFGLFFEKYVLCVFFIVTYLYNLFVANKNGNSLITFIVGTMPTNIYAGVFEFFRKNNFKEKIINILKIGITSILIFVICGRVRSFVNGLNEIQKMRSQFGGVESTIIQRINATSKMIEASIISLPSSKVDEKYLWNNIVDSPSYISLGIIVLMLIGAIKKIREKKNAYLAFCIACLFSVVLFVVLNWAVYESPLFSICFSWAIIPLVCAGIDVILEKVNIKDKNRIYIYIPITFVVLCINIYRIIDICRLY